MARYGRADSADDDLDRYYSPKWPVRLLVEAIDLDEWGPRAAEPCAGEGAIVEVLEGAGLEVTAGDIDPQSPYPELDARSERARKRYAECDSIITNPPYSCDAGSAADVLGLLLELGLPTAALLRDSWIEPCGQRGGWYTSDGPMQPDRIIMLTRVEYTGPALDGDSKNPGASGWWLWHVPGHERETRIEWRAKEDEERARGQEGLL